MSVATRAQLPSRMRLQESAVIEFEAAVKADEKTRPLNIRLYSGNAVEDGFGKIIVDLAGMSSKRDRPPILANHDRAQLIGYADKVTNDGKSLAVSGHAIRAMRATQEFEAAVDGGMSFEASMGFSIQRAKFVQKDESLTVNGRNFTGPGIVVTKSQLIEASVTPTGVDPNTASTLLSETEGGPIEVEYGETGMSNTTADPVAAFAAAQPDQVKKWQDEAYAKGASDTLARFTALQKQFADRPAFVVEQFAAGSDVAKASVAFADVIRAELAESNKQLAELKAKGAASEGHPGVPFNGKLSEGGKEKPDEALAKLPPKERAAKMWADNTDKCHEEFMDEAGLCACLELEAKEKKAA